MTIFDPLGQNNQKKAPGDHISKNLSGQRNFQKFMLKFSVMLNNSNIVRGKILSGNFSGPRAAPLKRRLAALGPAKIASVVSRWLAVAKIFKNF